MSNIDISKMKALAMKVGGVEWYEAGDSVILPDGDTIACCQSSIGHMPEPIHYDDMVEYLVSVSPAKILELIAALEAAAADKRELFALLPGPYYMDPPDGGDVSLIEQLRRMAKDAERYRWLRDEDAGVPDGEREMCVVQFRLPFTEDPDRDLFDVALDAAIDKALSQRQEES
ncbi:hypothetical protein LGN11_06455 [Burkholderia multivorans]|nr:hypothetical protein [Burkholderia multivorans]